MRSAEYFSSSSDSRESLHQLESRPFGSSGMRSADFFSSSSDSTESLHQLESLGDRSGRATRRPTESTGASLERQLRTPASPSVNAAFLIQGRGRGLGLDKPEESLGSEVPAPPERPFPSSVPAGGDSERTAARYDTPSELLIRLDSHRRISSTVKPPVRMVTPVLTSPVPACDLPSSSVDVGASMEGPAGDVRGLSSPGKSAQDGASAINKLEGSHESVHAARHALMKSELARLLRLYVHGVSGFRHFFHGYTVNAPTVDAVDGHCCDPIDDDEPLWLTRVKKIIDKKPHEKVFLEEQFLRKYGQTLPPEWSQLLNDKEYMLLSTNGKVYVYRRSSVAH